MLKINWLPLKLTIGFVLVMTLFFSMSGVIFSSREKVVATEVGSGLDNENEKIIFKSATYYKDKGLLEVEVFYEGTLKDATAELEMGAYNPVTKQKLKPQTEPINLNYYVIFIPEVKELKQIVLGFRTSDLEGVTSSDVPVINLTSENTKTKAKFVKRSSTEYEQNYVKDLIKISTIQLQQAEKEIKQFKKQIPAYLEAQEKLKAQLEFQTKEEQVTTQGKIDSHTETINQLKLSIQNKEAEVVKINEKIDLLKAKEK